jgi:hypothetical protein
MYITPEIINIQVLDQEYADFPGIITVEAPNRSVSQV